MDYIKLINQFWAMNRQDSFSATEKVLYFFLLDEANRNFWPEKFRCSTAMVCLLTNMCRSQVMRARQSLKARGLIDFTEGVRNSAMPVYEIKETYATTSATTPATTSATTDATINKTNTNTKTKTKDSVKASRTLVGIDKLEEKLTADKRWQAEVVNLLTEEGLRCPPDVTPFLRRYFLFLKVSKVERKTESDCRAHFFNKMRTDYLKKLTFNNLNTEKYGVNRQIEIPAATAEDYAGSF